MTLRESMVKQLKLQPPKEISFQFLYTATHKCSLRRSWYLINFGVKVLNQLNVCQSVNRLEKNRNTSQNKNLWNVLTQCKYYLAQ